MGDCQNYGPFLGPYYNTGPNTGPSLGDPKRDHNFDNPPYIWLIIWEFLFLGSFRGSGYVPYSTVVVSNIGVMIWENGKREWKLL